MGTIRYEQNDEEGTQALVLDKPISFGIIEEISPRTDDMTPRQQGENERVVANGTIDFGV